MSAMNPPAWSEALLRALLPSANEDSVSGDLLEHKPPACVLRVDGPARIPGT